MATTDLEDDKLLAKRRWYDGQPEMGKSIRILQAFPQEVVSVVADSMVQLAEKRYGAAEAANLRRSLGQEKILGLHKSKNKRRSYDVSPSLHKAINYHYVLPESQQRTLGQGILEMVSTVCEYFKQCQTTQSAPSLQKIQFLLYTYIARGRQGTEQALQTGLDKRTTPVTSERPKVSSQHETRRFDAEGGSRVSHDR